MGRLAPTGCSPTAISLRAFASTDELTLEQARDAPVRSYPRPSLLDRPLELRGRQAKGLDALGIETHRDLVEHFPRAHSERDARAVADLGVGEVGTVAVELRSISVRPTRNRRRTRVEGRVADASGPMVAVWWNQPWLADRLKPGSRLLLHGQRKERNQFAVREFEEIGAGGISAPGTGRVPLYPATEGIKAEQLRRMIWDHYGELRHALEPLPSGLRVAEALADRPAALAAIHFPDDEESQAGGPRPPALAAPIPPPH